MNKTPGKETQVCPYCDKTFTTVETDRAPDAEALAVGLETVLSMIDYGELWGIRLFHATDGSDARNDALRPIRADLAAYRAAHPVQSSTK